MGTGGRLTRHRVTASRSRAAKYDVDELVLAKELEQLGLPKGAHTALSARVRAR